jgi:BlaI family penicillinase repressor
MSGRRKPTVSVAELDVLRVLWDARGATLGEIHERLADRHAYTTVQTLLDRLVTKELVARDRRARPARHRAKISRAQAARHFADLIVEKICDGPAPLVLQLLRDESFSPEELAEIRRLIDEKRGQ